MYFASDNGAGASPKIIAALAEALCAGPTPSYGADPWTKRAEKAIADLFERDVAVFLMTSGTATNALGIAHVTPPWGAVYTSEMAHCFATECGAPEFYSNAKIVGIPAPAAKLTPALLEDKVGRVRLGDAHHCQPATISVTNLTECGTLYSADEIGAIGEVAKRHGLALHLDGARFANAVAASGRSPAEMSWKAGVDVMSLGATKNGAACAEAVVFFDPARGRDFHYRRMRGGHLLSKMRFVAAQFEAWIADDHWLALASHANAMAARLAAGLRAVGVDLAWAVEGNEVFAIVSRALQAELAAHGVATQTWPGSALPAGTAIPDGHVIARLIPSFSTTAAEVDTFLGLVERLLGHRAAAE